MAEPQPQKKETKKKAVAKYAPAAKFCPKCGARMAAHPDRFSCGRCTYTEWKAK